jgi:hypothetical protein
MANVLSALQAYVASIAHAHLPDMPAFVGAPKPTGQYQDSLQRPQNPTLAGREQGAQVPFAEVVTNPTASSAAEGCTQAEKRSPV